MTPSRAADTTKAANQKILGFNGLRALCVIAVFLSHKCDLKFYAAPMAVWAFFVLSGFLIIGELHRSRRDIEAGFYDISTAVRIFLIKRSLRILPAYYGLLGLLFLGKQIFGGSESNAGFIWHALYLSNYFSAYVSPDTGSPFGVLWSLSVEQQFYIFAPLALLFSPARLHVFACALTAVTAALGHFYMHAHGVSAGALYLTSPWNFGIIALGGLAGILMRQESNCARLYGYWPFIAAFTVVAAYGASWLFTKSPDPVDAASTVAAGIALAFIVAWIRVNQKSRAVLLLEWRPLEYLGVISYGFYLIHNFVPSRSIPGHIGLGNYPGNYPGL